MTYVLRYIWWCPVGYCSTEICNLKLTCLLCLMKDCVTETHGGMETEYQYILNVTTR